MNFSQLNFGILLDSESIEKWQYDIVKEAISINEVELTCIFIAEASQKKSKPSFWNFSKSSLREKLIVEEAFPSIPVSKDFNSSEAISFVLDLRTQSSINNTPILVPLYRFASPIDLLGFWELFYKRKTIRFAIELVSDNEDKQILKEGFFKAQFGLVKTQDLILKETKKWLSQICLNKLNNTTLIKRNETASISNDYPTNSQLISFLLITGLGRIKKAIRSNLYTDFWNIGIVKSPIYSFLEDEKPEVEWYPNITKTSFAADPFAMWEDNKLHIMFEAYPFNNPSGRIDYVCYENEEYSEETIVFDNPYHNSYPYLLKDKGNVYCVPESCANGSVELFQLEAFPNKWKHKKVLIENFAGADSTIIFRDGIWWMFTVELNDNPHYNLYLYHSNDLLGDWQPHAQNPVKTDVRSARPAGNIFEHNGNLYRPSMDYSEKIQGRITINKIEVLTKNDFKETPAKVVNPYSDTKYGDKIHTLAQAGNYTIVDGCKETSIFSNMTILKFALNQIFKR